MHTPGPWTIEEYGDDDAPALVIHKDSQTRVCFMATPGSHGDPAKIEADARLIAAAPDFLAFLRLLDRGLSAGKLEDQTIIQRDGEEIKMTPMSERVKTLIAKATG